LSNPITYKRKLPSLLGMGAFYPVLSRCLPSWTVIGKTL